MNIDSSKSDLVDNVLTRLRREGFTISARPSNARTSAADPSKRGPCACEEVEVGQVLSEEQVQKVGREGEDRHVLEIPSSTIVTPLAKERANDLNVEIRRV